MKISEAMRKGAKKGKQLIGSLDDENGNSCAMGAVGFGLGLDMRYTTAYTLYPQIKALLPKIGEPIACPECRALHSSEASGSNPSGIGVIVALNNRHGWSRERIADWVEQTYEGGKAKIPFAEIMEFIGLSETPKERTA